MARLKRLFALRFVCDNEGEEMLLRIVEMNENYEGGLREDRNMDRMSDFEFGCDSRGCSTRGNALPARLEM